MDVKGKPKQRISDFDELYQQAIDSQELYADQVKAYLYELKEKYNGLLDGVTFEQGPLKDRERALKKINGDYNGDPTKIGDLVRGRFVVEHAIQANILRKEIAEGAPPFSVEQFKDQFAEPTNTHFRALNSKIRLNNGHLAEFRVEHEEMLKAAEISHKPYERIQEIERKANEENRFLTPQETSALSDLLEQVRNIHNTAAASAKLDPFLTETARADIDAAKKHWTEKSSVSVQPSTPNCHSNLRLRIPEGIAGMDPKIVARINADLAKIGSRAVPETSGAPSTPKRGGQETQIV